MLMPAPRTARIVSSSKPKSDCPPNTISPRTRACGVSSRMMLRAVTDFPEPDSPTSPSDSPSPISNATSRTAGVQPPALAKSTFRSRTLRRLIERMTNDRSQLSIVLCELSFQREAKQRTPPSLRSKHQRQPILRVADDHDLRVLRIRELFGRFDAFPRQQLRRDARAHRLLEVADAFCLDALTVRFLLLFL